MSSVGLGLSVFFQYITVVIKVTPKLYVLWVAVLQSACDSCCEKKGPDFPGLKYIRMSSLH